MHGISRSAGTYWSAATMRSATRSGLSTSSVPTSITPSITSLPSSSFSTDTSTPDAAHSTDT